MEYMLHLMQQLE